MTSKFYLIVIQIFFFFLAITLMSFFADVVYLTSKGTSFCANCWRWVGEEFTPFNVFLRFAAAGVYVLFRNRRLFLKK